MTEASEYGAAVAWRLLATLEGGTFVLTTTAILLHMIRNKLVKYHIDRHKSRVESKKIVKNVIVTDTNSNLGGEIKTALALRGCHVTSGNQSGAVSDKYDAIVVIGAENTGNRLEDLSNLVSQDIYINLKVLESLCIRLQPGGYIVWVASSESRTGAASGATSGAFSDASKAFDNVLKTQLNELAKSCHATPIWIGRTETRVAERIADTLSNSGRINHENSFSVRNFASKLSSYIYRRWLKLLN